MAADEIHVGDIGVELEATITDGSAVDVSSNTLMEIWLKAPSGTKSGKTAVFKTDGTDGIIKYTTLANDLYEVGSWGIQAKIKLSGDTFHSDITNFTCYESFDV